MSAWVKVLNLGPMGGDSSGANVFLYPLRIHGTGIFTYMKTHKKSNHSCRVNIPVPWDPMGIEKMPAKRMLFLKGKFGQEV